MTTSLWVWQHPDWPQFRFDSQAVASALAHAHRMHGVVEGKASAIGLDSSREVVFDAFSDEVIATAEIEGQLLPLDAVRSSVMRRLGLAASGPVDRLVEGLVDVLNDATTAFDAPLTEDRLCRWQSALFPGGTSGIRRIVVVRYRDHEDPMQIVSGLPGREVVHYQAPPSREVGLHMQWFLDWFESTKLQATTGATMDGVARAAIAHLWFESIHPFEDGNGRVGRAIVDLALAQHLRQPVRLYSLSRQLLAARSAYYDALNLAQRGGCDVTEWVLWFGSQWAAACESASAVIDQALIKKRFWEQPAASGLLERQRKVLQRLLDAGDGGFLGGLNADKYIKMTGVSKPTATRDLTQMVAAGLLRGYGAGKATRYVIAVDGWTHGLELR